METQDTLKILAKVKAVWPRQPVDDAIMAEWAESLSRVSFFAAMKAVRTFRDEPRAELPTVGEFYALALKYDADTALLRPKLPPPNISDEERARNREYLHNLIASIGKKL